MTALIQTLDTADGPFTILADERQRVLVSGWTDDVEAILGRLPSRSRPDAVREAETDAAGAVRAYYAGDVTAIDAIPVAQTGTALQLAGWAALRGIAPGEPLTYTGFAARLGNPRAVRAAASICARNAPALFVPCHRVLRTDGSLGGFAWGLPVKERLLARERTAR
ncbi:MULTISPECIES: methylated-DNA--[protein]-cysteine S-methyltransferase [unclassified Microbacterium]|uniref:methylated-DNA--[protein]-cysteine S-methyltransferase n=1 Tax=unclassified Microbacterium TaxID=2609290 RepID=UPI002468D6D3|nr:MULTISPECIES: methylated-DNA--[protein]-cysteine S-methyltransferase [unclassified Microbacterium]MDH5133909.1 methylated-DNA--[protein]-cysteine S-methyltransferase [Microbacterium sp. RD10]MDH5137484.1 methylated-DNA--[protein]-cysteine S-methyltransferase [Microbacterium sp. RD11]MDH5146038.1 methylated-DNA--[protein]-cysteine S-methyltransferase [Microbacterium sp. RD12]MDH5155576.1 methylated-DNA--[protein]-cysteine S-methyltransferase [Microbacterium sp. RD06]MDH5168129.1 methylated-D